MSVIKLGPYKEPVNPDALDPFVLPTVRKAFPNLMAQEFISVQPMNAPTELKPKRVRWYHKIFQKRYWKMFYRLVTECHRGKHIMRHSCWGGDEFCEACFTHDPKMKIGYAKIYDRIFGGMTWRF